MLLPVGHRGLAPGVALFLAVLIARPFPVAEGMEPTPSQTEQAELSLITATPEGGLQVANRLARLGVTETLPNREVLHSLRPEYASDASALRGAGPSAPRRLDGPASEPYAANEGAVPSWT